MRPAFEEINARGHLFSLVRRLNRCHRRDPQRCVFTRTEVNLRNRKSLPPWAGNLRKIADRVDLPGRDLGDMAVILAQRRIS